LLSQFKAMIATVLSGLQNRSELFLLELEEEKTHLVELLLWALIVGVMGLMVLALATVFVILLFPEEMRMYAVAGFCVLYLVGAILALLNLKALLKKRPPPFSATINEIKKDRECFDSSK
jgi:uncharacterized membrane protein YqjE